MENDSRSAAQPPVAGYSTAGEGAGQKQWDTSPLQSRPATFQTLPEQNSGNPSSIEPLDMSTIAGALPDYTYRQMPQAMYQSAYAQQAQNPSLMYPYHNAPYPNTMAGNYSVPFAAQMPPQNYQAQRGYVGYQTNPSLGGGQHMFHGQPFFHQQSQMSPPMHGNFPMPQGQPYAQAPSVMYGTRMPPHQQGSQLRVDSFVNTAASGQGYSPAEIQGVPRSNSMSALQVPSALRGPPRKPKQSGHALWVGNLPPATNIIDLKDHFSRDATDEIESVFLISKSNCAFVNYKTEQSCTAAMGRFHDSRFNGVRLVCRLRRGSSPTSATTPSGIGAMNSLETKNGLIPELPHNDVQEDQQQSYEGEAKQMKGKVKEKYFIIKSLTVEDLERSVHSGIWATQSHNEDTLNNAYQTADNVYLVFSANKSGEYFGYARMDSAIDDELVSAADMSSVQTQTQTPSQVSSTSAAELPLTIPTPATATAPRGYIIDDSARGTIFWEAESTAPQPEPQTLGLSPSQTDSGNVSGDDATESQAKSSSTPTTTSPSTTFGKPFRITWMSTDRLPFFRTRGLRNPWNTNREVKIARDGTELEPGVGRKLVGMFGSNAGHNNHQPTGPFPTMMPTMPGQGPAYRSY